MISVEEFEKNYPGAVAAMNGLRATLDSTIGCADMLYSRGHVTRTEAVKVIRGAVARYMLGTETTITSVLIQTALRKAMLL